MVRRPDYPYWYNWAGWQLYHRHRKPKADKRRAAWEFINLVRRAPPGAIAIDCGANVGNVTAAMLRGGYEVYAFEPDPLAFDALKKRFAGRKDVHVEPYAVGTENTTQKLYRSVVNATDPLGATIRSTLRPWPTKDAVDVQVIDLIAFIRDLGRPVHLLKMDIEGSEVEILDRLLDEGLDRKIPRIYIETHERLSPELAVGTARVRERVAAANIRNINLDWF